MSVFFNGRLLVTPTVATRVDDTAMANKNLTVPMNLAIIGRADSGEPKTVFRIGNPMEAQELFKSGELLKAIEKAFSPSTMTYGPQTIYAVRVEPAAAAHVVLENAVAVETGACQALAAEPPATSLKFKAAPTGAVDGYYNGYMVRMTSGVAFGETNLVTDYVTATKIATLRYAWKNNPTAGDTYETTPSAICIETKDYGVNANRVKVKVQAATTSGLKVITALGDDTVTKDNIAAAYLTIQYTGALASGIVLVSGSTITVKAGVLSSEATIYTCDLSVYDTVEKVVDFFDSKPDITAVGNANYLTKPVVSSLDYVAVGQACKATAYSVTANLQAMVDYLNSLASPYVTAYRHPLVGAIAKVVDWQFCTGGVATAPVTQDWADCLNLLQTEDVQCVVPLTSTAAIHAAADAHCTFMSAQGGMERRCIVGGPLGETSAEVIARAYDLNSDRAYICYPGIKDFDSSGVLTDYAPYIAAAMLGGMICGSDPGTSLTNKTMTIRGVETTLRIPTDTDELILGGVIAITSTRKGYKCIQSVSTWLPNDNYNRVEMATGFAVDYVARNVRNNLEDLIGRKGTPGILVEAVSRVESQLKNLARTAPMGPEVIVGDSVNPAYKNITATLEGDVLRVYFECSPVIPVNYIPVGIAIVPYSGSASSV